MTGTTASDVWFGLTGLAPGTTYYYRIVATNPIGTAASSILSFTTAPQASTGALRFVPITPCRVMDTRNANGPLGGPALSPAAPRDFPLINGSCNLPPTAAAYSLNVAVVPQGQLGYLTVWPAGQAQPLVATLNSLDGRVKSAAAIIPAGAAGAISMYANALAPVDVILDVNGYFVPATDATALAYFPVTPCRLIDTRNATAALAGPVVAAFVDRSFPLLSGSCGIPATAQAYALNITGVPNEPSLGWVSAFPAGQAWPGVATLNDPVGTVASNAAIVPAGAGGAITVRTTHNTHLVIDVNGYFAPMTAGGLSLYNVTPCRVWDTRDPGRSGAFTGTQTLNLTQAACGIPATAQAVVMNATVVPTGVLGFLTLWPHAQTQPLVATLVAIDAAVTNNLAIVPTDNGVIDAYVLNSTAASQVILDASGYFAP